jgi:hypothetical protein
MKLFTWIKGLLQPQGDTISVNCQTMPLAKWEVWRRNGGYQPCSHGGTPNPPPRDFDDYLIARRRGSNPPSPGSKPPIKPQPTGGRLIYGDRDPGPAPPRLPDDLADLPVLTAQHLDGAAAAPALAEMPIDELMGRWREECRQLSADSDYAIPASSFMAQRVVAWTRQQLAQSPQLPPPGADSVATDGELLRVARSPVSLDDARRAIYERGRADERTAILRALGVEP